MYKKGKTAAREMALQHKINRHRIQPDIAWGTLIPFTPGLCKTTNDHVLNLTKMLIDRQYNKHHLFTIYPSTEKSLPEGFPVITQFPAVTVAENGKRGRLQCRGEGNPTPTVSWYRDYQLLELDGTRVRLEDGKEEK